MKSALERVETILQESDTGLTIQKIMINADVTEDEANASVRALFNMGQIEVIPTQGRWGNRYAWLGPISKPAPEPEPSQAPEPEIKYDMLEALEEIEQETEKILQDRVEPEKPESRYLIVVPKRKPRIIRGGEKAKQAAISAVRNGARRVEIYTLYHLGTATRGAIFNFVDGNDDGIS
ncbi:hypothetical protein [Orrella sp. 11846]|uniref:hypothetical protein n=1 Tax=Orrella sp. 11846 TaxID=3409913 RepID=UPI003B5C52B4